MDDAGPAHERASVTVARWALGGATAALVALASGATALLVVTSTTGVGLPLEDSHPLPGATADGSRGSADVLLLPGGSQAASGTRASRADDGSDDLLLVLRSTSSRAETTLTGRAARDVSDGSSTPAPARVPPSIGGAAEDGDVAPDATERPATERPATERPATERPASEGPATERPQRPSRPTPAPGGTTPPAEEEPEDGAPAKGPGRTPTAEPRPEASSDEDSDEDSDKGKAKDKDKKDGDDGDKDKKGDPGGH